MTKIDFSSVQLDIDVADDLANILAEDETSTLDLYLDDEWTLIIDVTNSANETQRMLIEHTLWESIYDA